MERLLKALGAGWNVFRGGKRVKGYVERIDASSVSGWAIDTRGSEIALAIKVGNRTRDVKAAWSDRPDVAASVGEHARRCGFRVQLDAKLATEVRRARARNEKVEVLGNGVPLRRVGSTRTTDTPLRVESIGVEFGSESARIGVEHWKPFGLVGWAVSGRDKPGSIGVVSNGVPVECAVSWCERNDIAARFGLACGKVGFELELPGYVWETAVDGNCALSLLLDGLEVTEKPLVLSVQRLVGWIADFASLEPDSRSQQYHGLMAVEHLKFSKAMNALPATVRSRVMQFAEELGVAGQLAGLDCGSFPADRHVVEDGSTQLHWAAMRALNARMEGYRGSPFVSVRDVLTEMRLRGEAKRRYLLSVVPLLCKSGEVEKLRELVQFSDFQSLETQESGWALSLAIPFLVADGYIERATAALWRLAKGKRDGWLNTECLGFAVANVERRAEEGEVPATDAEAFRHAFMGLLDALAEDWFSRLHDEELVRATGTLVRRSDGYADFHRNAIIRTALRCYGLSPSFWSKLGGDLSETLELDLSEARASFANLRDVIYSGGDRNVVNDLLVVEQFGNRDVDCLVRELILNTPANGLDIAQLRVLNLARHPTEIVRMTANPSCMGKEPAIDVQRRLMDLLHRMDTGKEFPTSQLLDAQLTAGRGIRALADTHDRNERRVLVDAIERMAITLGSEKCAFLGADVLSSAYCIVRTSGREYDHLLSSWIRLFRSGVSRTDGRDPHLPAAILSSLARLQGMGDDKLAQGMLAEARAILGAKFRDTFRRSSSRGQPIWQGNDQIGVERDTLVVIYSCRKYLETRVAKIRDTWLRDLVRRGVPYLVLVGDGEDAVEGDILGLKVSDRYEDLPKKSLALFRWVLKNTDFQYVLKIDDDCYLNVERFFDSLSYRKHHYYGRIIRRDVGSMDRAWHQSKSQSYAAQRILDKSPEPSCYADGGGGYTLSRLAAELLIEQADSPDGSRLVACSLMEDKLVGDLLDRAEISPSDEDYEAYQRRRTFGEAVPVGMWENTFFAARSTPTKVVHLDTADDQQVAHERKSSGELWPKKIWPTYEAPRLGVKWESGSIKGSNQLEVLSDPARVLKLMGERVVVVSVVRNEMTLLPHFLEHYRRLGIKGFAFIDNLSDDGSREFLLGEPDVALFSVDTDYKHSHYGVAWQQSILGNFRLGKWTVLADADEFVVFPSCESKGIDSFVDEIDAAGADAVRVDMIDMYPYSDLHQADFKRASPFVAASWFDRTPLIRWSLGSGHYSNSASFSSGLRHRLIPGSEPEAFVAQKYAFVRYAPWMRFSQGLHYGANLNVHSRPIWFAHFKYHAGFKDKVEAEVRRAQHFNGAQEYRRYRAMLAEVTGGFGAAGVSCKFEGSASFELGGCDEKNAKAILTNAYIQAK